MLLAFFLYVNSEEERKNYNLNKLMKEFVFLLSSAISNRVYILNVHYFSMTYYSYYYVFNVCFCVQHFQQQQYPV